jgi:hypothetical protein
MMDNMKNLLLLALSLSLAACVVDVDGTTPGDGSGSNTNTDPGTGGDGISGSITQSATWSGTVTFKGPATIESGVVITVSPGTTLAFVGSNSLTVKGTLDVQGTSASKVNIKPQSGTYFGGISNSGTLKLAYAVQKGGGIYTQAGSTTTITDTQLSGVQGDFLVMGGGDLTMTYSQVGVPSDTTHCQLHFGGGTATITKSNIVGAPYGFMFYGGSGTFTNNNWFGNGENVSLSSNGPGDFSGGFFEGVAPAGAMVTLNNRAAAKLTDAGVRP